MIESHVDRGERDVLRFRGWKLSAMAMVVTALLLGQVGSLKLDGQCGPNPIVCENQLPGNAASEWDISGAGDPSLQGFATDISVNKGQTVHFKVDTTAAAFQIDIYRLGYYGGLGARKIASLDTFVGQQQAACLNDATTGLVDCGNWIESASWSVPPDAVSGIYVARLLRPDTGGASHIVFVVRDDAAPADVLFQTSDTTWQAYNQYGGNSLYVGGPVGRAYKVSYNRPFTTRESGPEDWLFNAEYPMVRWLEANGYYVSYFTGVDTDRYGASELSRHRAFVAVGHDEYWSGAQRANVEAARAAGIHLAFFSGNEIFWKTRWEGSIDGTNTPYRTLVSYKETHANAVIDPAERTTWTGTWRDPRFSPPADGGRPENALTGTLFTVNCCTPGAGIQVSQDFAALPFWRNTRIAALPPGGSTTLSPGTLGYEWDEDLDNGFRPAGLTPLSSTTLSVTQKLQDYGSTYGAGTATHALTIYQHPSGALVFGAGTVQWSWGLDDVHDRGASTPDLAMQQATLNLFTDMGVSAGSLQPGLVSTPEMTPPTVVMTAPGAGATVTCVVAVTATAIDNVAVAGVQFQLDGVNLGGEVPTAPYTVMWNTTPASDGSHMLTAVARDAAGNTATAAAVVVTVNNASVGGCSRSVWSAASAPAFIETADPNPVELGMRFRADADGTIGAVRFYKSAASPGPHVGHLWTDNGTLLGTVTFSSETASGWQQASFAAPIAIAANTTYIVSYFAPAGQYAADNNYFATGVDAAPLHALADSASGANGVYHYGASAFPANTYQATNYWVDIVFTPTASPPADTIPPQVAVTAPLAGATVSGAAVAVSATATDNLAVVGVQFKLDGVNLGPGLVNGPYGVTWNTTTVTDGSHTLTAVARDEAGNAATSTGVIVMVSNADSVPPNVAAVTPASGSTGAPVSTRPTVRFSEAMNAASINSTSFELRDSTAALVPATVAYDALSFTVTITPTVALASLSSYTVTVKGGAGGVADLAGNALASSATWTFTTAPSADPTTFSIWSLATPPSAQADDPNAAELGVKFVADTSGFVTGLRFYKYSQNSGTHVGSLWTTKGTLLGTVTFANETASGWQQAAFASPIPIDADTTYVASYHTNTGFYAVTQPGFANAVDHAPLHALADSGSGGNGVYVYGPNSAFPTQTYQATNYWVDLVFSPNALPPPDTTAPTVVVTAPGSGATVTGVVAVTATTTDNVAVAGVQFQLDGVNLGGEALTAPYTVMWNTTAASNGSHTLTAVARDAAGNTATAAAVVVTVNNASIGGCPCSVWSAASAPAFIETADPNPVELGMRFRADADGTIGAVRFYKSAASPGPHVGHLWTDNGTLLGTVTFSSETASGWQQASFAAPIAIAANTTYIVSYFAPAGQYAADNNYFATGVDAAPLHALADSASGANGVYHYGASAFPANTYQATNYWVDVVFTPTPP